MSRRAQKGAYVKDREVCQNLSKLEGSCGSCELDFAHIKLSDGTDGHALVDDGRSLPLGFGEHNIDQLRSLRDGLDGLKVIQDHLINSDFEGGSSRR